jgi:hypothetical protein
MEIIWEGAPGQIRPGIPRGIGRLCRTTESNAGCRMHVVGKTGSQIYDGNLRYEVFAFRRDQNGTPDYYWDGVLIKDSNVLTTGHLWLNSDVWLYNGYVSFRGISPSTLLPHKTWRW